jgi:hypothetical protein
MAVRLNFNARHDALGDGNFLASDGKSRDVNAVTERWHGTDLEWLDVLEEVVVRGLEQREVAVIAHTDHPARHVISLCKYF